MTRRLLIEADGGSRGNPGPAGYGAVVKDAVTGDVLAERAAGIGTATNNVAEYGGLIAGLKAALDLEPAEVEVRMDSKLVVEQMSGRWQVKHPSMKPLAREAAALVAQLPRVRFAWIPREQNKHADRLANEAMDAAARGEVWSLDAADTFLQQAAAMPNRLSGWQEETSPPTTTLLLRHGQTVLSVEKRFSGTGDQPLTEVGRAQAAAAAVRLTSSGAVAVVSSPLRRARETAALVGEALSVDVSYDDGFRETDFGQWEGYTFAEVRQKWPQEMAAWLASTAVAPPFGESFDATATRVRQARDRVLSAYGGQTVVVVSHVTPIKTLLRVALEAPPVALYRMHLDLACLCEVQWSADGPAVVRSLNDTGHLPA
ncbi:MAG: bifunctional RNase H/acid phosphatase [Actinobacteria bacterium]|nr:bifunctional RNase H/acid phosphatase [Actinomycetota bacterium]MCA1722599.1 bifunctional RNase H/acid phosphatase [Actinomycetota bacterium]